MKKTFSALVLSAVLLTAVPGQAGTKEQLIQLQTQVQALQDEMSRMRQSFDERMGVMRSLIEQTTDNINKMNAGMASLQRALEQQNNEGGSRTDKVSDQVQALHDSVDELKARLTRVSQQLDEVKAMRETLNTVSAPVQPPAAQAPPADILYGNAIRDYNAARYDLAMQQFQDYMKFYASTELAGNAQFYIADILYRQGDFENAVKEYDKAIEQFPGGNKAAASQLKKGFALLELGQKQAGTRELNSLISRYPRSVEAQQARDRLRKAGAGGTTARKPSPGRSQ